MSDQQSDELRKLAAIAIDLTYPAKVRTKATEALGNISTHEALLALLDLAANDKLPIKERDLALKEAREVIKTGHA